jgi:hypothetical protein
MVRAFILSLLLAAFVGQGWAQSGMVPAEPASQADCSGQIEHGTGGDCCPDGASATGACASLCSAAFALATVVPEVDASRDQFRSIFSQVVRAGPRYLPLNPPPIS